MYAPFAPHAWAADDRGWDPLRMDSQMHRWQLLHRNAAMRAQNLCREVVFVLFSVAGEALLKIKAYDCITVSQFKRLLGRSVSGRWFCEHKLQVLGRTFFFCNKYLQFNLCAGTEPILQYEPHYLQYDHGHDMDRNNIDWTRPLL